MPLERLSCQGLAIPSPGGVSVPIPRLGTSGLSQTQLVTHSQCHGLGYDTTDRPLLKSMTLQGLGLAFSSLSWRIEYMHFRHARLEFPPYLQQGSFCVELCAIGAWRTCANADTMPNVRGWATALDDDDNSILRRPQSDRPIFTLQIPAATYSRYFSSVWRLPRFQLLISCADSPANICRPVGRLLAFSHRPTYG